MGEFTNRPENSLTEVSYKTRERDVHAFLDRLEARFAECEPTLKAFVAEEGRFVRLHREAEALLATYPRADLRPYLFGVPVAVADVIQVDGFPTRAGSRLNPEVLHGGEADVVGELRSRGALILGKTVCAEFGYGAPSAGANRAGAAAVAADLCPLALGVQSAGGIHESAGACGVVGCTPSHGRIAAQGVIPLAPALDRCGYFTADAETASVAAMIVCRDWFPAAPQAPVLGIPEGPYLAQVTEERLAHFRDTCDWLSGRYRVRSVPVMQDLDKIEARCGRLLAAEAARAHGAWFDSFSELYSRPMAELIARGREVSARQLGSDRSGGEKLRRELGAVMEGRRVDLWLSPAAPGSDPRAADGGQGSVMGLPWSYAGMPSLSVPAGRDRAGLPVGLQITARYGADANLLAWAPEIARVAVL